MFPPARRPWVQFILDHNPLLLLSTVLMLLGCYLVNSSVHSSGDLLKLLALLGTVNLYEFCIIPLGLVLIRRSRGTARDGWWLLLFESLFLVNGTFLHVDPNLLGGWWLNVLMLLLALGKAAILMKGLKLGFGPRTFGFLAAQLTLIYCLPIFLWYASDNGVMPPRLMYLLWWIVGLLPVAYDLLARADTTPLRFDLVQTVIRRTYLVAPWLMLVIHLRFSHWAHHADFVWADLAPVCLGLAVAMTRTRLPLPVQQVQWLLPLAALLLTLTAPADLIIPMPFFPAVESLRPGVLVLLATLITYGYLVSLWAALWTSVFLFLACCTFILQDRIYAILLFFLRIAARIYNALADLVPHTAAAWGVVAIAAAFLFLALGARLSLRRDRPDSL
jgi:hypothetical protein